MLRLRDGRAVDFLQPRTLSRLLGGPVAVASPTGGAVPAAAIPVPTPPPPPPLPQPPSGVTLDDSAMDLEGSGDDGEMDEETALRLALEMSLGADTAATTPSAPAAAPAPAADAAAAPAPVAAPAPPAPPAPAVPGLLTSVSTPEESMEILRQVSRYFNCELFFEEEQVISLIRGLSSVPKANRIEFFETAVRSRRRDRMDWRGTDIEAVFVHSDEHKLMRLQDLATRVRSAVRSRYGSLLEAFSAFDADGDSWLSYRELQSAIQGLGLDVAADDAVELILQADRNADGFLDYRCVAMNIPNGCARWGCAYVEGSGVGEWFHWFP